MNCPPLPTHKDIAFTGSPDWMTNLFLVKWCLRQEQGEQLLWLLCLQVYQGALPKNSYRETQSTLKYTIYSFNYYYWLCYYVFIHIYMYVYILIYFPLIQTFRLDGWRKRSYDKTKSKQFQESIAGFFNEQVIDSKGEFYFDPTLSLKPS